ncbi:MAG: hypothetical protein SOZ43_01470 [Eubacteriales bacterium]|nr:hypothetical protein [Eubacteriales bacterium]
MFELTSKKSTKTGLSRTPAGNDLDFFFCLGGRVLFLLRSFRSNTKRKRHPPVFGQQKRVRGIDRIVFPCLKKRKAPTVTGCGVSRGIGLPVGSGSPLLFGDMLCKIKLKREWTRKQVGKENTEALPMGATEEPGRYRHALSDPFLTCFCPRR